MAVLLLIAIGWAYIVVLMAAAEAFGPSGTVLGALVTFVAYGVLPLSVVLYVGSTGLRRRARERALAAEASTTDACVSAPDDPGGRGHAPGAPLAPEREEP